ncbi:solute carrier family 28 member 3-like isoform X2 [Acanthaster planci]|uniref:Sodium/nucleoside cotransporter n=1 Tax=Acanthaster planci TaxID=133434 RepID=A0A8B7Z054_ACAPL|nr:solute carrier family 28 member 3-like isoform X2 [Acanthaster planci]
MSTNGKKSSKLVFKEGNGPAGRDNVNCVVELDEITPPKAIDLTELPPGPVGSDPEDVDVTDVAPRRQNGFNKRVEKVDKAIKGFIRSHRQPIKWAVYILLLLLFVAYVIAAVVLDFHRALALFVLSMLALAYATCRVIQHFCGARIVSGAVSCRQRKCGVFISERKLLITCLVYILFTALLIAMCALTGVIQSIVREPERLKSLFGLVCFLLLSFVLSKQPGLINWRTVFWGLWLQMFLAILILRTQPGFDSFNWLGKQVESFLNFTNAGAEFVFGPAPLSNHEILLTVLPVIIFTSSVFALMYYWGVMQTLIRGLAVIMQFTMDVSGAESFATASNIFVGMTVAPLAIKPYLNDMTESEMYAVIVGGFATIAGSVLALFIAFGISASHLLAASFMSAPAALVTAKMSLPETKAPKTASSANIKTAKALESNALEAMYVGAIDGLKICAYIIGNLVAIISVLAFINSALAWLGGLVDIENLSFQLICRYVLYPLAWLLGVDGADCLVVAELIGIKVFLNEIVAYNALAEYVDNEEISTRTQVIATYALCGFANLGSIGVMMGGLIPLVPHRKSEVSRLCVRALLASCVALFMTASIAGLLYDENQIYDPIPGGGGATPTVNATMKAAV